jgi:phosphatidylglycerophosphate synthase
MVVIIVARELAITGLRLLAASKNVVLAAEGYGKHKTISQIVAIISILVLNSYKEWGVVGKGVFGFDVFGKPWINWFTPVSIWVAVALTFISGALYLWRNRQLYLQDL